MPENRNADITAIAEEIKRYLHAHPNAADSLDGIVKWWLPRQRYEETLVRVQQALDYLVAHGLVSRVTAAGDRVVYTHSRKTNDNSREF